MDFAFGDEELMMGEAARSALARSLPFSLLRAQIDDGIPFRAEQWRMAAEAGWTGALVRKEDGGSGLGLVQMSLPLVECGAALLPLPIVEGALAFPAVVSNYGTAEQRRRWLPGLARGEYMPTMRLRGELPYSRELDGLTAAPHGEDWVVDGTVEAVPFGCQCDVVLVKATAVASEGGTPSGLSPLSLLLTAEDRGVRWSPVDGFDLTTPMARAELHEVLVPADRVIARGSNCDALIVRASQIARIGSALLAVGGMKRVVSDTTEYITTRSQFGKPIGAFQAVKHFAANMRHRLDTAEPAAYYAAWGFDNNAPDDFESAAVAYVAACEGFLEVAKTGLQLHGAVGYTWDRGIHLYLRRAQYLLTSAGSTRSACVELGRRARTTGMATLA